MAELVTPLVPSGKVLRQNLPIHLQHSTIHSYLYLIHTSSQCVSQDYIFLSHNSKTEALKRLGSKILVPEGGSEQYITTLSRLKSQFGRATSLRSNKRLSPPAGMTQCVPADILYDSSHILIALQTPGRLSDLQSPTPESEDIATQLSETYWWVVCASRWPQIQQIFSHICLRHTGV